ncbi:MAG TPA: M14 family zinc carboxypeptidase, partial [Anaerolineae bacterium]|nr:M14 family zinc carboxypeptidase [Anaerolineae bacterium]
MESRKTSKLRLISLSFVCLVLLLAPFSTLAGSNNPGPWWIVEPEDEVPAPQYDSILYSEIAPLLHEIELNSNRVKVDVIGQSAGGRNMFLVTLSDPKAMGRLGQYMAIRQTMLKDPEKAQAMIDRFGDFKVPVFINASIHGNEYPGVDAAIRLIETLAYENTPEVRAILDNVILLVNVVANPDGRVLGTRANANGFDVNRDFITQSQPETRAMVEIMTEWNPMVVLDLHGFINPMLIEPCTPPHNPNYEYDLYIQWAFYEAEAMEAELQAQTGFTAQIPFRDSDLGWDDWPPTYTPMYGMYHGGLGHTLETPYRDERGVDAHFAAVWGALKFVVANRAAMIHDQIEIFRRGFLDLPQILIPDELLDETQYNQYNLLTIQEFPAAYIIPPDTPTQYSDHQVARLIDFLLFNDAQVEKASQSFTLDGVTYPAGSYIVWMDQPKRGLANTMLEAGRNLSDISGLTFYSPPTVWSNLLLWGVYGAVTEDFFDVASAPVNKADAPQGSVQGGLADAYAFEPTSLEAFQAVNALLGEGETVFRAGQVFDDGGRTFGAGTFII